MPKWLRALNEHDRDVFEIELAEDTARASRAFEAWLNRKSRDEGYDPDLDDPNGYLGVDERERDLRGEP